MATVEFDPQPLQAYTNLEKAGAEKLLDAIDDAIDALETDPGNAVVRRRWKRGAKGTRTPDLLHAIQARTVAKWGQAPHGVPFTCSDFGWARPGVACWLAMLAPSLAPRRPVTIADFGGPIGASWLRRPCISAVPRRDAPGHLGRPVSCPKLYNSMHE